MQSLVATARHDKQKVVLQAAAVLWPFKAMMWKYCLVADVDAFFKQHRQGTQVVSDSSASGDGDAPVKVRKGGFPSWKEGVQERCLQHRLSELARSICRGTFKAAAGHLG